MKIFSSIVSFFQRQIVKAAAKALPRLLSNHWLDCLYTEIECQVHHVIDLDHLGPVWIAQTLKKYDDFLGSVQFRLDGKLWRMTKTHYDWYGVVYYDLTDDEGYTRSFWSEESRMSDELKQLRNFSEFMEKHNYKVGWVRQSLLSLYDHKDVLELREILTAARECVTDAYEPNWVTELPNRIDMWLHLTELEKAQHDTEPQYAPCTQPTLILDDNF